MHQLIVDDERYDITDHREALRHAGHTFQWVPDLDGALAVLEGVGAQPQPDLVLIDLMLGCEIPPLLRLGYGRLMDHHHNEGQALGQWLWHQAGRRCRSGGPMHCYFSHVPQFYQLAEQSTEQEFALPGANLPSGTKPPGLDRLLLSKSVVRPSALPQALTAVATWWDDLPPADASGRP